MSLYLRAIRYFRADLRLICCFITAIGFSIALGLLQAWPTAVIIDAVFATQPRTDWPHRLFLAPLPNNKLAQIIGVTAIGMILWIVQHGLTLVKNMLQKTFTNRGTMRVRCALFEKLQDLDLGYHRSKPQGDAIYRIITDTQGPQVVLNTLIDSACAVATLIAMALTMFSRSVPLTLCSLAIAPLMVLTNIVFARVIKARTAGAKEIETRMTTSVQRAMSSIALVKAFGRERAERQGFATLAKQSARSWIRLNWGEETYWLVVRLLYAIGGAVVFGYGGYLAYRDQFFHPIPDGMTIGAVTVFMGYLGGLWDPLEKLTSFSTHIQPGVVGTERVFEVLDREIGVKESPTAQPLPVRPRRISLESVTLEYGRAEQVLRGVSVNIEPGEMVAFVGPSGVGKSSLLALLPRFYDPSTGSVKFDAIDARQIRTDDLRRHIALVLQENMILPTTIAENLAYGSPGATCEQIREAAEWAGAAAFIEKLPAGYDTELNEGGLNLSPGQRQRIAIARALLTQAPILLLDEPTSALDPENEALITATLRSLRGRRTIIQVSHRLHTLNACDQIYVMAGGRIVEHGTHESLLARGGTYSSMYHQEQSSLASPEYDDVQAA